MSPPPSLPYPLTATVAGLTLTAPFVAPEELERRRGRGFRARMGANENVFGPSPRAIEAMARAAAEAWKYGDPTSHELRQALAAHHGVAPANLVVGEGIDGLFASALRLFVEPGVAVVTSLGAYPTFAFAAVAAGGRLVTAPYADDREDPDGLLDLAEREGARVVYLANPDNPMGSWLDAAPLEAAIARMPAGRVLFLDEAYTDFAPPGSVPRIDVADPRVLRFRTFSKAYGLAGARVGYAIGEAGLIATFDRVRCHFGVNLIGQAGALAALLDGAHLAEIVQRVARGRERIAAAALAVGLTPLPSAANFVTIDCGGDGAFARRVVAELGERDVFVRMPAAPPLDRCIRVSVETDAGIAVFAAALPLALAAARAG